ncbi:NAD-dependent epimerase/dehydratase terH [Apiospora arundinis]|uniref:NAD-dependent epimerase/dehydratase terH n=1 Tax=Apiospora arundinis TaxID=335852 RepID=A0ABR2JBW5_9PEZI
MANNNHPTAIPAGSLVLITGITSYVASYTAKDLLERGHRVRGIVRSLPQAAWLTEEVFPSFAASGAFDLVEIPDLAAPKAFDKVLLNSQPSAVIHIAMLMSFDADPNKVVTPTVQTMSNLLRAAALVPSVRRFVYTSSIGAAYSPRVGVPATLTRDSWNEAAVEAAWAPPPYKPERGGKVYAAAKVTAERTMFQFVEDTKPGLTVTSVAPFFVMGPVLHRRHLEGSAGWVRNVFAGEPKVSGVIPFGCQINVQDVATLHVAAVLDPGVKGDRLIAAAEPFNINVVLAILRRQYPDRQFMDDLPSQGELCLATIEDEDRQLGLLKKWSGRNKWISLEKGVQEALEVIP